MCAPNLLILLLICIPNVYSYCTLWFLNEFDFSKFIIVHTAYIANWLIFIAKIYAYILSYLNVHYLFYVSRTIDNNWFFFKQQNHDLSLYWVKLIFMYYTFLLLYYNFIIIIICTYYALGMWVIK